MIRYLGEQFPECKVVPLATAKTSSGQHVMQMWHHLASNEDVNKDQNTKIKSHGGARQGSESHLTPKDTVSSVISRGNLQRWTKLCDRLQTGHDNRKVLRLRTDSTFTDNVLPSKIAIRPEKGTHAHNRECVLAKNPAKMISGNILITSVNEHGTISD